MTEKTRAPVPDPVAAYDPMAAEVTASDQYKVKLEVFEGPLDLLLYLIKKEEVSIYDIPIARITDQYLVYVTAMQQLDISVAGEFLLMAATLIHIKSQMLLPRDPDAPENIEDPRAELVQQLLDHQRFKSAANALHQMATVESGVYTRASIESDSNNPEIAATAFQLFEVFSEVLKRREAIGEIEIARDEVTIAEKIAEIRLMLRDTTEIGARQLFERARSRREMVLVFLSILELVKSLAVRLEQVEAFGDIKIIRRDETETLEPEVGDEQQESDNAMETMPVTESAPSTESNEFRDNGEL